MKTTKLMLVAILIASTTFVMAQAERPGEPAPTPEPQSITIHLKAALQSRGLVYAMRTQLNPDFLRYEKPLYCIPVKYKQRLVYITGSLNEWKSFFNLNNDNPILDESRQIPLRKAAADRKLFRAMHEQLSVTMLQNEQPMYTAKVKFNHKTIYVFGTYSDWKWFFRIDTVSDPLDS